MQSIVIIKYGAPLARWVGVFPSGIVDGDIALHRIFNSVGEYCPIAITHHAVIQCEDSALIFGQFAAEMRDSVCTTEGKNNWFHMGIGSCKSTINKLIAAAGRQ